MKKNFIKIIIVFVLVINCISCNNNDTEIGKIDIEKAYKKRKNIKLSTIAEAIDYVILETKKECVINKYVRVYLTKNNIVIIAQNQQLVFNRNSGKYIRNIGHVGKDPYAYSSTRKQVSNDDFRTIYANKGKDVIIYSLYGEAIGQIKKPTNINNIRSITHVNKNTFLVYTSNYNGNDTIKLAVIDETNEVKKLMPNYQFFTKNTKTYRFWGSNEGDFYKYGNNIFLKELFNDTIFRVGTDKLHHTKYVFDTGKYRFPDKERDFIDIEKQKSYYLINGVFESDRYVFFRLKYNNELRSGLFDKKYNLTIIADSKDVELITSGWGNHGYVNDLDNFMQFVPQSLCLDNLLVSYIEPFKIKEWFEKNQDKIDSMPPNVLKLRDIKEDDNAIIQIVKLKE